MSLSQAAAPTIPAAPTGPTRSRSLLLVPVLRPIYTSVRYIRRAIRAGSYPIRGIWYFLLHPEFYPLFVGRLLPLSIISFIVYLLLFTFTFLPQYLFMLIFQGPASAFINTTVLVLGEGQVIIQALFEGFFVDECQVDIFDATLINYGYTDLIAPQRIIFVDAPNAVRMLGKPTRRAEFWPFSWKQIIELIVCLPINLIPYIGNVAFIMITGSRLGKLSHHRWFVLRGLDRREKKREWKLRRWEYLWFGTVAMVLELVPILSFFFLLTTAAGAAMWTARLEEQARVRIGRPITAEDVWNEEVDGPVYHDDPV